MTGKFKKLRLAQVQERLNKFLALTKEPVPQKGWIRTLRDTLGMSSYSLSKRVGCSRANISSIERREQTGNISLETMEQIAKAMNCKLVYCLVPLQPLDKILENQARDKAKQQIRSINHSMKLEKQGLTSQQLKQQENNLVEELLKGDPKYLWDDDEI